MYYLYHYTFKIFNDFCSVGGSITHSALKQADEYVYDLVVHLYLRKFQEEPRSVQKANSYQLIVCTV